MSARPGEQVTLGHTHTHTHTNTKRCRFLNQSPSRSCTHQAHSAGKVTCYCCSWISAARTNVQLTEGSDGSRAQGSPSGSRAASDSPLERHRYAPAGDAVHVVRDTAETERVERTREKSTKVNAAGESERCHAMSSYLENTSRKGHGCVCSTCEHPSPLSDQQRVRMRHSTPFSLQKQIHMEHTIGGGQRVCKYVRLRCLFCAHRRTTSTSSSQRPTHRHSKDDREWARQGSVQCVVAAPLHILSHTDTTSGNLVKSNRSGSVC